MPNEINKLLEEFNKLETEIITLINLSKSSDNTVIPSFTKSLSDSIKLRLHSIIYVNKTLLETNSENEFFNENKENIKDIVSTFVIFLWYKLILNIIQKTSTNIGVLLPIMEILNTDKTLNEELELLTDALVKFTDVR